MTFFEGKCPIIVGGTHYYIETLLWGTIATENEFVNSHNSQIEGESKANVEISLVGEKEDVCEETLSEYDKLKAIDSHMADLIHPNDSRKIRRYLDLYEQTGVLPSEVDFFDSPFHMIEFQISISWYKRT